MEECELNLENVKRERDILSQELQTAKEKIHSLESVVNTIGSDESSPAYNHQVQSLTKQVIKSHFVLNNGFYSIEFRLIFKNYNTLKLFLKNLILS